jgi:2-keto-3-deoxy-galactonokinase
VAVDPVRLIQRGLSLTAPGTHSKWRLIHGPKRENFGKIASIASKGLRGAKLTQREVKSLSASVLTQSPDPAT